MTDGPPPIAVGGVGGSGTRAVAEVLRGAGLFIGDDLNRSLDNLWFTLLLKRPRWLPGALRRGDPAVSRGLSIFGRAMGGTLRPGPVDLAYIARAVAETASFGHDASGAGRGGWALHRASSLLRSRRSRGRWAWKEPATWLLLDRLPGTFPGIRYIHVVRHGLDQAFSRNREDVRTWGRLVGVPAADSPSPSDALRYWLASTERVLRVAPAAVGEDRFLMVRLEELCRDPAAGVRRLLRFAGMDVARVDVERLARVPVMPPSAGKFLEEDLGGLAAEDLRRVEALGFPLDRPPAGRAGRRRRAPERRPAATEPTVSVALCTYQGERFLPEQLRSLMDQSRPPDEVVVSDDGSADHTLHLLEEFRAEAPFPVRIEVTPRRLGSTRNFERAIGRCREEIILLCDQDDVWHPRKIERLAAMFHERPGVGIVFTDAELMDDRSRSLGIRLWEALPFDERVRDRFASGHAVRILSRGNLITGAAMAFHSRYRDLVLPIPEGWVQDAWIGLLVAAAGTVAMIPAPLIHYRIHGAQQIGVPTPLSPGEIVLRRAQVVRRMRKDERQAMHERGVHLEAVRRRLRERDGAFPVDPRALAEMEAVIAHLHARGRMADARPRLPLVLAELASGRYHRYGNGLSSAAKDLLLLDRGVPR